MVKSLPDTLDTEITVEIVNGSFSFSLSSTNHEDILVKFLLDFNGFLVKHVLLAGNPSWKTVGLSPETALQSGGFFSNGNSFSCSSENGIIKTIPRLYLCEMVNSRNSPSCVMATSRPIQLNSWSEILFTQSSLRRGYIPEVIASFVPDRNAIAINSYSTESFTTFRRLIYAIIASERIYYSDLPEEIKAKQIYFNVIARRFVEEPERTRQSLDYGV